MSKLLTAILAGLVMVGPLTVDMYQPSFPALREHFGVSDAMLQQTLSVYAAALAFMTLFHGTLADTFGRRPVLLVSLMIYIAASIGAALAPGFEWLMACRAVQGLAAGASMVISRVVVRDRLSGAEAQRILSIIMMIFCTAPAVSPMMGGWLQVLIGWRATFLFLAGFGALMLFACWSRLEESLPMASRQPFRPGVVLRNYVTVIRHPQFLLLALSISFSYGSFYLYLSSAPSFLIHILHLPLTAFGWLSIPHVIGMVTGSALSARYAHCVPPRLLIVWGYAVMGTAALANVLYNRFFTAAVPWAIVPSLFFTLGLALVTLAVSIKAVDLFPDNRGLAGSLQSFLQICAPAVCLASSHS